MPASTALINTTSINFRRLAFRARGFSVVESLVYLTATARTGVADPTELSHPSRGTTAFNSDMTVFREGLETVLIFAAVIASFVGVNKLPRRPVIIGAGVAFFAAFVTWFVVQAALDVASPLGPRLEAITGFVAITALLVILNWFAQTAIGATLGLILLGFTSVYREGFEVVLFLQNLELKSGSSAVMDGVAIGLVANAVVGVITFWLHRKLPYRKMREPVEVGA